MRRSAGPVSGARAALAWVFAGWLTTGCVGATSCSYPILAELAPEATWNAQSTYLDSALADWNGTRRIGRWEERDFPLVVAFEWAPDWSSERRATVQRLVMESFGWWSDSVRPGLPSWRVADGSERPDLVVRWSPVSLQEQLGAAGFSRSGIDVFYNRWKAVDIWLLEQYAEEDAAETLQRVAAHEAGHALGINGHSSDTGDLMYPTTKGASRPSARDLATLRGLYLCRAKTMWLDE